MATTQYIGARYVPLFFTNPDDNSNDWKSGVAYDPLTIVTDLNQSYTSKIPVPASVGRPSENPTYWILTGAYNAQVEQYREEVEQYREDVEEVNTTAMIGARSSMLYNKKVVVYGDSTSQDTYNYWRHVSDYGVDVTNRAIGGASLYGILSTLSGASDLTQFDVLFLTFGTNEWQGHYPKTQVESSIKDAVSIIRGKNPIIPIYFITPFWSKNAEFASGVVNVNNHGMTLEDYCDIYNETASSLGCGVIDFYHSSGCGPENYSSLLAQSVSYGDIWVHENDTFSKILADLVLNASYDTKPFITNTCKHNYIDILNFGAYKVTSDTFYGNTVPSGARGGLVIQSAGMMQAAGWTYLPSVPMRLSGYASSAFTFAILRPNSTEYADSVTIQAGYFDYKFTPTVNGGKITFTPSSGTLTLGKLMLCEVNSNESFDNFYGYGTAVRPGSGVTFGNPLRLFANDKYITISDAACTLSAEVAALGTLGTFDAHMTPDGIYTFAFQGSTMYPLMFSGNGQVRPLVAMPAGTYRIMGSTHTAER